MPSLHHKKLKERIALAERIEAANQVALTCSYCRAHAYRCLLLPTESLRCSGCVRSKRRCDTRGLAPVPPAEPVPKKLVCQFFFGPRQPFSFARPPTPPVVETPWFPAFELDTFLADLDHDLSDAFWATLDSGGEMTQASQNT
jgi:hypothetical protein